MTDEELCKRLRNLTGGFADACRADAAADRIEALTAKLAEMVEAASPLLNMAVWTESAEDTDMVIVSAGTVRRIRATLAEIEEAKP